MPFKIAQKYTDMNELMTDFIPYLTDNAKRLGVSQTTVAEAAALKTTYSDAYAVYANPETQTKIARETVENAYKSLLAKVRQIQQSLKKNVDITLTEQDHNVLDIHIDKDTRTRAPIPEFVPINEAIENTRLRTKFAARVPTGAEVDHKGMPIGAPRLMREVAITDTAETPPTDADFASINTVGRTEHSVMWDTAEAHKTGWLRTRWANNRGETGPYSEITRVDING